MTFALSRLTKRPRDVSAIQAASILYGDWGTSKAYVIGLSFALVGYSAFWLIALLSILNVLVGINYIAICKYYPGGGGVYASVHKRSKVLAMVAAFFLIADYLVTAALSALSAFNYLGVPNPEQWSIIAIFIVGALNYLGPRHTGNLAFLLTIPTLIVIIALAAMSLPFGGEAVSNLKPIQGGFEINWIHFVSIVVGMSGIEAIANTTGVMVLNRDGKEPSVTHTSTPAILSVMIEVTVFTAILAFMATALPNLEFADGNINAPGHPQIRDYLLRYMGEYFATGLFGASIGALFSFAVSLVFCALLLSAVNTAIVALVSLLFVMSRDGSVPEKFQKLNSYGVPWYPLILATLIPMWLVFQIEDVAGLADLYAVGFVGAIATNLCSTSTDKKIPMSFKERLIMFATFLIMAAIEVTLFIEKPDARHFVMTIMACGLFLKAFVAEQRRAQAKAPEKAPIPKKTYSVVNEDYIAPVQDGAVLCAVSQVGKTLDFAIEECSQHRHPLYLLYLKSQAVITEEDREKNWLEDKDACKVFDYAKEHLDHISIHFLYSVTDAPAYTVVQLAEKLMIRRVIVGEPRAHKLIQAVRGNIAQDVRKILPRKIDLIVIS